MRGKRGKVVAEEVVVGSRVFLPSVRTGTLSSDSGGAGKVFSREREEHLIQTLRSHSDPCKGWPWP